MAKRLPASLLGHAYSPSRYSVPTGLRRLSVAVTPGRKVSRVNQYNKLPTWRQHFLRTTNQREAFLRGEVTWTEAKRTARPTAIEQGLARPVRLRLTGADKRAAIARKLYDLTLEAPPRPDDWPSTVIPPEVWEDRYDEMTPRQQRRAEDIATHAMLADAATDPEEMEGPRNPFWYH